MTDYTRYALYYTATGTDLAQRGAAWLGWDIAEGRACAQPEGLEEVTERPRKYGFHGTLKPPFRLSDTETPDTLHRAARGLATRLQPFDLPAFRVTRLGSFLALTTEESAPLRDLAAACVTDLDRFRAPPTEEELAKRRAKGLSPAQDAYLTQWGYPYVMDEFRFHLTLTGPVPAPKRSALTARATAHFNVGQGPHRFATITLCGERPDGRFEAMDVLPLGS